MALFMDHPTQEDQKEWLQTQQEIYGKDAIPDSLLEDPGANVVNLEPGRPETVAESAAQLLDAKGFYQYGEFWIKVKEPTVGQIWNWLLPHAGQLKEMAANSASDDELMAQMQGTVGFQKLMLDCLIFRQEDGDVPPPVDRVQWFMERSATEALALANIYLDGINWPALIRQAEQLAGKLQGMGASMPQFLQRK